MLLKNFDNIVHLVGTIDEEKFQEFSEQLLELEKSGETKATILLTSGGGQVEAALAFIGRMRLSPLVFTIIAMGDASSAATLILASGDSRYATKETHMLFHEESDKIKGMVTNLEKQVAHLRAIENEWNELLEKYTNTPAAVWAKIHAEDRHISATEAKKLGVIDGIV